MPRMWIWSGQQLRLHVIEYNQAEHISVSMVDAIERTELLLAFLRALRNAVGCDLAFPVAQRRAVLRASNKSA
jgi:hypothetical protein